MTSSYPQQPGPFTPPSGPAYPQPGDSRPLHKRKRVWAGGFVLLLIGTGCGAMGSEDGAKNGAAKPAPTVTVTTTATAKPTAKAPEKKAPAKATPKETPAAPAIETAELPSFVGMNHQDAQDTAQAAGFFNLREKDGTGMERLMILDRNWKVCKQEPAPGKHAVEKTITLYSVKTDESC